ncbi:MAG: response regulator [Proteobacteria bacterium]|nr:response regulator [Pseudomonadota bacterium]
MMVEHNEEFLTPAEVANLLGVAPVTVRAWANKGLCADRITPGGHRRFARHEVERFARERGIPFAAGSGGGAARTLVVDDDPQIRRLLCEFLETHGVETAIAGDGFEAGFKVATFHPTVVLLDLKMPGMDGLEVCRRIKADPATRTTRVVFLSGYMNSETREAMRVAGAELCLEKPLDMALLASHLELGGAARVADNLR